MEGCEGGNKKFKDDGKVREGRSFSSLLISLPIVDVLVIRSIKYIYIYNLVEGNDHPPFGFLFSLEQRVWRSG